ncbi:MAG: DUF2149 domain-containing protein [Capnocytophaga sp.]|nr:DUF2149 domain-containing protein [Capnocytophaga sp.]
MKPTKRISPLWNNEESDPLSVVVNLFDVAMVFAVALMVAMVMNMNMTEVFTKEDFTVVKNPGKDNMEIITKEGGKINKYVPSDNNDTSQKKGKRVGTAYQLENGEIIYVPE